MTETSTVPSVVYRGYKMRLAPNRAQLSVLRQQVGAARVAYNMMCAHNHPIEQRRADRHRELIDAGLDSATAWDQVKKEAETNPSLKIVGYQKFDTDVLTLERGRHRAAAADIEAGADPATVWGREERYPEPWLHTANRRVLLSGFRNCGQAISNRITGSSRFGVRS